MAYSHTIHLTMDGIDLEGEITFNGTENPKVSFTNVALDITQFNRIGSYFNQTIDLFKTCGEIELIEIKKKP